MSLEELNQKLKEQNLIGYWTIPNTSTGFREPEPNFRPFLWKWNEIRAALDQAAAVHSPRRSLPPIYRLPAPGIEVGHGAHACSWARKWSGPASSRRRIVTPWARSASSSKATAPQPSSKASRCRWNRAI